jgi:hypothetical protein
LLTDDFDQLDIFQRELRGLIEEKIGNLESSTDNQAL